MNGRTQLILGEHAACQTALLRDLQASVEVTTLSPWGGSGLDSFRSLLGLVNCLWGRPRSSGPLNLTAVQY